MYNLELNNNVLKILNLIISVNMQKNGGDIKWKTIRNYLYMKQKMAKSN